MLPVPTEKGVQVFISPVFYSSQLTIGLSRMERTIPRSLSQQALKYRVYGFKDQRRNIEHEEREDSCVYQSAQCTCCRRAFQDFIGQLSDSMEVQSYTI